jgi:hypothetical protein
MQVPIAIALSPARRDHGVLWHSLALRPDTCTAVRELSRDWPPARHGSSAGPGRDVQFATSGWPHESRILSRLAARHLRWNSRRFSGSVKGTYPRGAGDCLWSGDHDAAGLADRAAKSPFPTAVLSGQQHAEMHLHIAGRAFRGRDTALRGRLHVCPRGRRAVPRHSADSTGRWRAANFRNERPSARVGCVALSCGATTIAMPQRMSWRHCALLAAWRLQWDLSTTINQQIHIRSGSWSIRPNGTHAWSG